MACQGWQHQIGLTTKAYSLGIEDRKMVDKVFDDMQRDGKVGWMKDTTQFGCPVFVSWKNINGQRKGHKAIDLRATISAPAE